MQGFKLSQEQVIELLSVYATSQNQILAVAATPGWNIEGAFTMPATASVVVDLIGSVSDASLQMHARLYDITPGSIGPVSGSTASLNSTSDSQAFSGVVTLLNGHTYQFQVEVVGNVGDPYFGNVRRATLDGVDN